MRDKAPDRPICLIQPDGRANSMCLGFHPDISNLVRCQFALAAGVMKAGLEIMKTDLADNGIEHILDLACQQCAALHLVFTPVKQTAEDQHFAENRCCFSQGQRRRAHQIALRGSHHLMHAMAKFMGKCHDIAHLTTVIHQDIGMCRGHSGMTESPGSLALALGGIDPAAIKEP